MASDSQSKETGVIDPKKSCRVCGWSGPLGAKHACPQSSNQKVVLEAVLASFKEADDERYAQLADWRANAGKCKGNDDMYGWNFHEGMAAGCNWASLFFNGVRRELERLIGECPPVETTAAPRLRVRVTPRSKEVYDALVKFQQVGELADIELAPPPVETAAVTSMDHGGGPFDRDGNEGPNKPSENGRASL